MKKVKLLLTMVLLVLILNQNMIVNAKSVEISNYSLKLYSSTNYNSDLYDDDNDIDNDSGYLDFLEFIFTIVLLSIILFIFVKKVKKMNQYYKDKEEQKKKEEENNRLVIEANNLTVEEVKQIIFDKYKEIQIAYTNFDYNTLSNCCSKLLFDEYCSKLEKLKKNNLKNKIAGWSNEYCSIEKCEQRNNELIIDVLLDIDCYDYTVDNSGKVIEGFEDELIEFYYEMRFIKKNDEWLLDNKKKLMQYYKSEYIENHKYLLKAKKIVKDKIEKLYNHKMI